MLGGNQNWMKNNITLFSTSAQFAGDDIHSILLACSLRAARCCRIGGGSKWIKEETKKGYLWDFFKDKIGYCHEFYTKGAEIYRPIGRKRQSLSACLPFPPTFPIHRATAATCSSCSSCPSCAITVVLMRDEGPGIRDKRDDHLQYPEKLASSRAGSYLPPQWIETHQRHMLCHSPFPLEEHRWNGT